MVVGDQDAVSFRHGVSAPPPRAIMILVEGDEQAGISRRAGGVSALRMATKML
jgi:hypothetical protein